MIPRWLGALLAFTMMVTAGSALALVYLHSPYSIRIERAGEVKKDQEKVSAPTPPVQPPASFGPVPHVIVQSVTGATEPTPVTTEPTPAPLPKARPKAKKKSSAAKKLKSKWAAPVARPFSLGDLFNVR